MTDIQTATFVRKPLYVQAIQVSAENLEKVAEWCGGRIFGKGTKRFINLDIPNARHPRQTKAYSGDWVTVIGTSFKIYTETAFKENFDSVLCETHKIAGCFVCARIEYGGSLKHLAKDLGSTEVDFKTPPPQEFVEFNETEKKIWGATS